LISLFFYIQGSKILLFSYSLLCVETVVTTETVTTEPEVLERLEVVETVLEPTVVEASEVVVVTNQLLTSDEATES